MSRAYTTRRQQVVQALCDQINLIDGKGDWLTNVHGVAEPKLKFLGDQTNEISIHVVAGQETREYQGGGFKWRFMEVPITIYIQRGSDPANLLEHVMQDIETCLDNNVETAVALQEKLNASVVDIFVLSINTDQGAFDDEGLAIGEMIFQVRY